MGECAAQATIPGFVKRLRHSTQSDSSVCCTKEECTKTFGDAAVFERELFVYLLGLPYVPRLRTYDRAALTLTVERVGASLGSMWDSGTGFGTFFRRERKTWDTKIRELSRAFRRDTGLNHNDILYKNVLLDPVTKRLYLIDFELSDETLTEADVDGILSGYDPRALSLALVVALCALLLVLRRRRARTF